ncbi:MAG: oligosaccharide flippase family protein [Thermoplasmatota archaeon]
MNAGRKATLVLVSNLAGAALGYVGLLLIGRYFAPASYGSYLFALSVTGMVSIVSNLGLGIAHQRHIAQGIDTGRALGVLVRMRAALAAGMLALLGAGYWMYTAVLGKTLTDATTPTVLATALAIQVLSGYRQVLFDTWQGLQQVNRIESLRLLDTALGLVLLSNAALLIAHLDGRWEVVPGVGRFWAERLGWTRHPGPGQAALLLAACYLGAKAASLAVAFAWSMRDRLRVGSWDAELARSYLRLAIPFALTGTLALVLQYTDTLMLGFFWTAREVGLYGAAQKLALLCLIAASAVGAVLFPRFATLQASGDRAGEASTFAKAERYLLLLVTPLAAAMVALPVEGLHVAVGDGYLEAAEPLRLLALWALLATLGQALVSRSMAGSLPLLVRATTINAVGNVVLNLLLIPPWGLGMGPSGAALATLLSTVASYAFLRFHGRRLHGIPWTDSHQLRIAAAGVAVASFWVAARRLAGAAAFDRIWELGAWGLAGAALYALLLLALRELRGGDLEFVRKVAHPRLLLAELRQR